MLRKTTLIAAKVTAQWTALAATAGVATAAGATPAPPELIQHFTHFAAVTDFLVYFVVLAGLLLLLLGRRVGLRLGIVSSLGAAVFLAAVLSSLQANRGVFLDSQPFAITIPLLVLIGVLWFGAITRVFDADRLLALAAAYSLAYGCATAAMPSLVRNLADNASLLSLVLFLAFPAAFVVALLQIAFTWWPLAPNPAALRCQQGALSEHLHAGSAMVVAHLKELARVVTRYEAEPSRVKLLAGPALCRMAVSRRGVERDLENLVRVGSALETLDALDFALLRRRVALLPAHAQTEVRLQLSAVRQRLAADKMESKLLRRVVANTSGFAEALTKALSCLEEGRTGDAHTKIIAALRLEQEAKVLSAEIAARVARYQREGARIVARAHLTRDGARA